MNNMMLKFKILQEVDKKYLNHIKLFYVPFEHEVLFITDDDKVYYYYSFKQKVQKCLQELCDRKVVKFCSSYCSYLALTRDGNVYGWGDNMFGQLGNGTIDVCETPTIIAALQQYDIVDVCSGYYHNLFLSKEGIVLSVGRNSFGQIGNTNFEHQLMPFVIETIDLRVTAIACGYDHSMATTMNGVVYVWGDNNFGQIGLLNTKEQTSPIILNLPSVKKITCGRLNTLLLTNDGDIYFCGHISSSYTLTKPTKIISFEKFQDIAASIYFYTNLAQSECNEIFLVSIDKVNNVKLMKDESHTLNEAFIKYSNLQITYKNVILMPEEYLDSLNVVQFAHWNNEIYEKLYKIYSNNLEALLRIIFYLNQKDYQDVKSEKQTAWKLLKQKFHSETEFNKYAECLVDETKSAENDLEFRDTIRNFYSQMIEQSKNEALNDFGQESGTLSSTTKNLGNIYALKGFIKAWNIIPVSVQTQILEIIPMLVENEQFMASKDKEYGVMNKNRRKVKMVTLSGLTLGLRAMTYLKLWWKCEITSIICATTIVESFFATEARLSGILAVTLGLTGGIIGAVVEGSVGGTAIGLLAPTIGIFVGDFLSARSNLEVKNIAINRLVHSIFDLPKDKALENAYKFMGVKMSATNNDINTNFRRLCKMYQPTRGRDELEFLVVQIHMGIIKLARKN